MGYRGREELADTTQAGGIICSWVAPFFTPSLILVARGRAEQAKIFQKYGK